jgi:hypothetical protein
VRWCAAANPAEPCRTGALHHCVCVEYPPKASAVLSSSRARARVAAPTDPIIACEHPIAHGCKAATEAEIDTEALVCSGSRCSCP